MLAACNICFLKTINLIEVQKYIFGTNGLSVQRLKAKFKTRVGLIRYFLIFSIIKNTYFYIFYQVNNLSLHQSYLKSTLLVKLT